MTGLGNTIGVADGVSHFYQMSARLGLPLCSQSLAISLHLRLASAGGDFLQTILIRHAERFCYLFNLFPALAELFS
jgi:hypothetical protein